MKKRTYDESQVHDILCIFEEMQRIYLADENENLNSFRDNHGAVEFREAAIGLLDPINHLWDTYGEEYGMCFDYSFVPLVLEHLAVGSQGLVIKITEAESTIKEVIKTEVLEEIERYVARFIKERYGLDESDYIDFLDTEELYQEMKGDFGSVDIAARFVESLASEHGLTSIKSNKDKLASTSELTNSKP